MSETNAQIEVKRSQQIGAAEELLFAGPQKLGVAKGLFLGRFVANWVMPYPTVSREEEPELNDSLARLRAFLDEHLDPAAIDRQADIPRELIDGLARLGVFGMTAPRDVGGRGFSQMAYCRVMEEIGSRCASTSIFVNVQHSVGMRALLLFGTPEQKGRWLPPLVRGEQLAAFALTEAEAGSDAANIQTFARPDADGSHFLLNGEKRYITSGAIAQVLTVMARMPVPGKEEPAITAFLVTPDMPGFVVLEPRMEKLGIRGTATARLAFRDMPVPKDYMLETAMLKVFSTEALWMLVSEAFQVHGGAAYFTDRPLERMLRDARINQIGEGANEVLTSFIALVGMRAPGEQFREILQAFQNPWGEWRKAWLLSMDRVGAAVRAPPVP